MRRHNGTPERTRRISGLGQGCLGLTAPGAWSYGLRGEPEKKKPAPSHSPWRPGMRSFLPWFGRKPDSIFFSCRSGGRLSGGHTPLTQDHPPPAFDPRPYIPYPLHTLSHGRCLRWAGRPAASASSLKALLHGLVLSIDDATDDGAWITRSHTHLSTSPKEIDQAASWRAGSGGQPPVRHRRSRDGSRSVQGSWRHGSVRRKRYRWIRIKGAVQGGPLRAGQDRKAVSRSP
jgi:hypothetical protein